MNIQPLNLTKSHFTNPENGLRAGRLQRSPSLYVDGAGSPSAREQRISKLLLALILVALLGGVPSLAIAQLTNINPIKDNTLYQYDARRRRHQQCAWQPLLRRRDRHGRAPPGRACLRHRWKHSGRLNDSRRDLELEHVENS